MQGCIRRTSSFGVAACRRGRAGVLQAVLLSVVLTLCGPAPAQPYIYLDFRRFQWTGDHVQRSTEMARIVDRLLPVARALVRVGFFDRPTLAYALGYPDTAMLADPDTVVFTDAIGAPVFWGIGCARMSRGFLESRERAQLYFDQVRAVPTVFYVHIYWANSREPVPEVVSPHAPLRLGLSRIGMEVPDSFILAVHVLLLLHEHGFEGITYTQAPGAYISFEYLGLDEEAFGHWHRMDEGTRVNLTRIEEEFTRAGYFDLYRTVLVALALAIHGHDPHFVPPVAPAPPLPLPAPPVAPTAARGPPAAVNNSALQLALALPAGNSSLSSSAASSGLAATPSSSSMSSVPPSSSSPSSSRAASLSCSCCGDVHIPGRRGNGSGPGALR